MQLSIVIPCYNEQETLPHLIARTTAIAATVTDDHEIILVNDGSTDNSWQIIRQFANHNPRLIGINLSRNFGHQAALTAGLANCSGERVLILDADLQDPPELLPDMMKLIDEGADVVYGKRSQRMDESLFKRISAHLFYRLLNTLSETSIPMDTGDFRLVTRRVVAAFFRMPEQQRFVRGMIAWIGFRQVGITYKRQPRLAGNSSYPLSRMLLLAADAIASFSISPLRASVFLALVFATAGLVALCYVLFSWLVLDYVRGWTSIAAILCFLGSAQLLVLGILGEYIGRIYLETKSRPLYLIDEICKSSLSP